MPLLLWQGCVSDASGAGDANEKASQSPHSRSLRRTFRKKVPAPSPSLPSVKKSEYEEFEQNHRRLVGGLDRSYSRRARRAKKAEGL
jgi:hypothetical protein